MDRDERIWCVATLAARLDGCLSDLAHVATCVRALAPELDPVLMDAVAALWSLRDRVYVIAQEGKDDDQ